MANFPSHRQIENAKGDELYKLAQKYGIQGRKNMRIDQLREALLKRIKYVRMTDVILRELSKEGLQVLRSGRHGFK